MPTQSVTAAAFLEAKRLLDSFVTDPANLDRIEALAVLLHQRFAAGRKVLVCGNGGSACDAMHFAEEFTGRYRKDRRPLPVMALADAGHITCTANDYGFEHVYARPVEAFGRAGDVLIVLSTSGNSANIVRAVGAAKAAGMATVALLGRGGGRLRGMCDHEIVAPGETADRIQELHMLVLHVVIEGVERLMFPENYATA